MVCKSRGGQEGVRRESGGGQEGIKRGFGGGQERVRRGSGRGQEGAKALLRNNRILIITVQVLLRKFHKMK
jgi:hypothetical protein